MSDFVIHTDSGCDLPRETLSEMGVELCELTFRFNNSDKEYKCPDMPSGEFYRRMREGQVAKTAPPSPTKPPATSWWLTVMRQQVSCSLGWQC